MIRCFSVFMFLTVSLFGSMNLDQFEAQFDKAYQAGEFQSVLESRKDQNENDLKYECKEVYADLLFSQGKISLVEKKGIQVFFKIEKMQKMFEAANQSKKHSIVHLVEEADRVTVP